MSAPCGMLAGRTALVVGIDDIGAGIARRYAREGARVALLDPEDPPRCTRLAADLPDATAVPSLAGDWPGLGTSVSSAAEALGALDILVCNLLPPSSPRRLEQAGNAGLGTALSRIDAAAAAMRAALPALRESGRGRIVLVGHRYGESVGEGLAAYNAAAWALVGLGRTAALEWGPYQIATNVLLPVARTAEFEAAYARRPGVIDLLVSQLPLRRVGDPVEDVGGAATFLASDAVCFVNGEVVHADGGQHVAGPVLNPARFA